MEVWEWDMDEKWRYGNGSMGMEVWEWRYGNGAWECGIWEQF